MTVVKNPVIWGPPLWDILHYVTFHYNPSTTTPKQIERLFLQHVPNLLPCEPCRKHYCGYVKKNPITTRSRESLSRWLVKIHNLTNAQLGKPQMKYEDAVRRYNTPYARRRVKNAFFKWGNIMTDNIRLGTVKEQMSYGDFVSFIVNHI